MKYINTILTEIAVKHLRIPTLAERCSDRLDFHCVSVWGVRIALQAAFDAGTAGALPRPEPVGELPAPYDAYEIHGVAFVNTERTICEPVEDADAEMWTLYGHVSGQGGRSDRRLPHARACRGGLCTRHGPSLSRRHELLSRERPGADLEETGELRGANRLRGRLGLPFSLLPGPLQ